MKPVGIIGMLLLIGSIIVLAMNGIHVKTDTDKVEVGPLKIVTTEKHFIPPIAAIGGILIGAAMIYAGRSSRS